mgnify:CR=1 FL=1
MDHNSEGESPAIQTMGENHPEFDWTVVKSLITAQSHTTTSLERYLLAVTHDGFELNQEAVDKCLEDAIRHHNEAVKDLKAARELIEMTDQD